MNNLVERLRTAPVHNRPATLLNEAADYIEELKSDVKILTLYLEEIKWKATIATNPMEMVNGDKNDNNT